MKIGIKLLLGLSVLATLTLATMWPFSPQVEFDPIPTSFCDADTNIVSNYAMSLTNDGFANIWLAASSPTNPVYVHASGYTDKGHMSATTLDDTIEMMGKKVHWIALGPGQSIELQLGAAMLRPHLLGLLVRDWRGREAEIWSETYTPPHM